MPTLSNILGSLDLVEARLQLANGAEQEEQRDSLTALILLLITVYGVSYMVAQAQARRWLQQYSSAQIQQLVFNRVLLNRVQDSVGLLSRFSAEQRQQLVRDLLRLGGQSRGAELWPVAGCSASEL